VPFSSTVPPFIDMNVNDEGKTKRGGRDRFGFQKIKKVLLKSKISWAPVAHTCNPSYSGCRDQEDRGLKPAWANSSGRPYLQKYPTQKRAGEGLKV
jgi:hypothetical protein